MSKQIKVTQSLDAETDQLRVQLAGCMIAAEGGSPVAVVGDYGWSPAYQSVVELRKLYKKAIAALEAIDAGFLDGSIKFTHKRKSSDEPYHKANMLMTAALAAHSGKG